MDRLIVAAFVATFIAAIAAVVGVPVFAQTTPSTAPDTPRGRVAAMATDHDGFLMPDELKLGSTKLRAANEAKVN